MTETELADLWTAAQKSHREHRFTSRDRLWTYRTTGSGEHVLVALPGALGGADLYFVLMGVLSDTTRVIAVDVPYVSSTSDVNDALVQILDREGVHTATFLGASFGGMLAQAFAQAHPDRVRALILSQTGSPGGLSRKSRFWARAVRVIPLFVLRGLMRLLLGRLLRRVPGGAFWNGYFREVVDALEPTSFQARYELSADLAESFDWTPGGPGLWRGPVTILQSRKDSLVGRRAQETLADLYPTARSEFFRTEGHGAYVHDPVGFSRAVEACLG